MSKRQAIAFPDIRFEDPQLNRLMEFVRRLATELQKVQQLLRAGNAGQVLAKASSQDYDGAWTDSGGGGSISGAENIGPGHGLFAGDSGTLLTFKSLLEGANITIVADAHTLTIAAAGSTGGSGTVTSVGIASDDLTVAGSPIGTSGNITLNIGAHKVTYGKMQQSSTDGVVLGRRLGDGAGDIEELSAVDLVALVGGGGYSKQLAYAGIT